MPTPMKRAEQSLQMTLADHLRARADLIPIKDGRTYGLELKADKDRVSPAQAQAHQEMRAAGAEVAVAVGIDDALAQLERWRLLKE